MAEGQRGCRANENRVITSNGSRGACVAFGEEGELVSRGAREQSPVGDPLASTLRNGSTSDRSVSGTVHRTGHCVDGFTVCQVVFRAWCVFGV